MFGFSDTQSNPNYVYNFLFFLDVIKVPLYVIAQVGGSVLATYAGKFVYDIKPELMLTTPLHHGWIPAFFVEFVATFIVLFLTTALFNNVQSVSTHQDRLLFFHQHLHNHASFNICCYRIVFTGFDLLYTSDILSSLFEFLNFRKY